jgi:hypothetical protein
VPALLLLLNRTLIHIYKVINNKNMYMYTIKIKNSGVAIATVCHHMDPPLNGWDGGA